MQTLLLLHKFFCTKFKQTDVFMKQFYTILLVISCLCFFSIASLAQNPEKNHGIVSNQAHAAANLLDFFSPIKSFTPTDPPLAPVVNLAEFNHAQGTLVRYPFGIPITLIKAIAEDYQVTTIVSSASQQTTVLNQYTSNGVNTANCDFLIAPSNSYWTRDYGPWFVLDSSYTVSVSDFPYNRPSRPQDDDIPVKVAQLMNYPLFGMNVIHTGGNYMCDGMGKAASTDLVVEENPTQTVAEINQKFMDYLGVETYYIRPDPNGTYIDHIDCWSKFLDVDKILVRQVPTSHPQYALIEAAAAFWQTAISGYGTTYQVFRVNTPNDQPYTNSYIINKKVFVPLKGNATYDNQAMLVYQNAMPGYEVVGVYEAASTPWESTDALHCRTHEMGDKNMLYVKHMPILTQQPSDEDYHLSAIIAPLSGSALVADSTLVYYKVNGGSYQTLPLTKTGYRSYSATIPRQAEGSTIAYYLKAKDASGNVMLHPYIGEPDPHVFTVGAAVHAHMAIDNHVIDTVSTPGNTVNSSFTIENTGSADLIYTVAADASSSTWIIPQSTGGVLSPSANAQINVLLDASLLSVGTYQGKIYVNSNDPDLPKDSILVTFEVNSGVGITKPVSVAQINITPNPFTANTLIKLNVTESTSIDLGVYDLAGNCVKNILNQYITAGIHSIQWDGTGQAGQDLPQGVYIIRMTSNKEVKQARVVLVR
jgi:agmatine/peptidylarginine deiminase